MAKAAMNEIWGTLFSPINMAGMAKQTGCKGLGEVYGDGMVRGRARGCKGSLCPTPPPPQIAPPGPLPPHRPTLSPPSDPPPPRAFGPLLLRGGHAQKRGDVPSVCHPCPRPMPMSPSHVPIPCPCPMSLSHLPVLVINCGSSPVAVAAPVTVPAPASAFALAPPPDPAPSPCPCPSFCPGSCCYLSSFPVRTRVPVPVRPCPCLFLCHCCHP